MSDRVLPLLVHEFAPLSKYFAPNETLSSVRENLRTVVECVDEADGVLMVLFLSRIKDPNDLEAKEGEWRNLALPPNPQTDVLRYCGTLVPQRTPAPHKGVRIDLVADQCRARGVDFSLVRRIDFSHNEISELDLHPIIDLIKATPNLEVLDVSFSLFGQSLLDQFRTRNDDDPSEKLRQMIHQLLSPDGLEHPRSHFICIQETPLSSADCLATLNGFPWAALCRLIFIPACWLDCSRWQLPQFADAILATHRAYYSKYG